MQTCINSFIQSSPPVSHSYNITSKSGGFPTYNNDELINIQREISNLQKSLLNGDKDIDLKYALKSKQLLELGHFHEKQVEKITDCEHQIQLFKSILEKEENLKKELKIINFKLTSQLEETENKYLLQNDELDRVKRQLEQKTEEAESSKLMILNDVRRFNVLNDNLDKITGEKLDLQNKYETIESLYHQSRERNVELINENSQLKSKLKSSTDNYSILKRKHDDAITGQGIKEKEYQSRKKKLEIRISADKEKIEKLTACVNEKNRAIINLSQAMSQDLTQFQTIRDQIDQFINLKTDHLKLVPKK